MRDLHVATCGLGVNSVAGLIKKTKGGVIFDVILFADPGKENPKSYRYIDGFNKWLNEHGQPSITIVRQINRHGEFIGLYNNCINENMLPSIVYGYKSCSQKYKKAPQDKWMNNWEPAQITWKSGFKVIKYLWYDADESHRTGTNYSDDKYTYSYPLVDANIGRFECVKIILEEGLPLPPKSSCTFCPSMKPWEIIELYETEPKEFYDAITMERNAAANLTNIDGLGRHWSWWDVILAYKYLKLVKKHKSMGAIPYRIKKMMERINRSKPIDYEKLANLRISAKDNVCDLFSQNIDTPCECMD